MNSDIAIMMVFFIKSVFLKVLCERNSLKLVRICRLQKANLFPLLSSSTQIFIHMLPPYLYMTRPKVETPLSLDVIPRREKQMVMSISKAADEYFIRKPDLSILFPKPNR